MNRDFAEMLSALSDAGADVLVVGAHALAVHGTPRATGGLDIWVRATAENARRVWQALVSFGAPLRELSLEDLASPGVVFEIGIVPCRIDLLTSLTGLDFEVAWARRVLHRVEGLEVPFLSRDDLIANKRALGRKKDLADVAALEGEE